MRNESLEDMNVNEDTCIQFVQGVPKNRPFSYFEPLNLIERAENDTLRVKFNFNGGH